MARRVSALIHKYINNADVILFRIQGARSAAYPQRYVSNLENCSKVEMFKS